MSKASFVHSVVPCTHHKYTVATCLLLCVVLSTPRMSEGYPSGGTRITMAIESRECGVVSKPCADLALDRLLLQSIGETIHVLLGDKPQQVLFERLDDDFHLKREEIPDRLGDFQRALTALLGAGSPVLTRAIIRNLCSKLEIPFVRKDEYDFEAYVADCIRRSQVRPDSE